MASISVAQAREDVAALFLSYLGRAPEFQAMNYYVGLYNQFLAEQGDAAAGVSNAFKALSAQIYIDAGNVGEIPTGPSVSDAEYVNWIYQNVLGRAADEGGLQYWVEQLEAGAIVRAELVGIVIAAAFEDDRDGAYLANRTEVALEFAKFENSNPQILGSLPYNAKQVLEGVNEDPASVVAAQDKLNGATNGGQTFNLTQGVDNLTGTSGNDVFNALPVNPATGEAATTLNAYDTIDGGLGRDTLNIYVQDGANAKQQGTIRNIEIINIHNDVDSQPFGMEYDGFVIMAPSRTVNVAAFEGVEQVWQFNQAADVANLGANVIAGFNSIEGQSWFDVRATNAATQATLAFENVTIDHDTNIYASGKALTGVVVQGAIGQSEEDGDAEVTISLRNTNEALKGDVTFTVNTAVDAKIELSVESSGAKIVGLDASASTGDIQYAVQAGVKSVKGGAGDDLFFFAANRALTSQDSVDGGEGLDTVVLGQGGTFVTQDYNALNGVTNVEVLAFVGEDVSVDAAQLSGFDVLAFGGDGTVVISKLAANQSVVVFENEEFGSTSTENIVLVESAADVSLTLDSSQAAGPKFLATDAGAFESTDYFGVGEDVEDALGTLVGKQGETGGTLTVDGEGWLYYGNAGGKFATIDVSNLEGVFALYSMAGDVAETIKAGEAVALVIGLDVAGASSTLGLMDVIEGFVLPEEGVSNGPATYLSGISSIVEFKLGADVTTKEQAYTAAADAYAAATTLDDDGVVLFQWKGDTYLYANTNDLSNDKYDNADFMIKIVGTFSAEELESTFAG